MTKCHDRYEHRYRFSVDEEIVARFKHYELYPGRKTYLIEFRSKFILETINGQDQIIDSERLEFQFHDPHQLNVVMDGPIDYRLGEYWMTVDEIMELEREAFIFMCQAEALYACPRRVIPLAIDIEVRTVQQRGESIGGAMDRAIKPVDLAPMEFWYRKRESWAAVRLMEMTRYRIGDGKEEDFDLPRMEICDICSEGPRIGAEMSVMDCCNDIFHSACLVRWMLHNPYCPSCLH